jgi:Domain of unknown function DUF11
LGRGQTGASQVRAAAALIFRPGVALIGVGRILAGFVALAVLSACGSQAASPLFATSTPSPEAGPATTAAATDASPRPVSTRPSGPRPEVPLSVSVELGTPTPQVGQDFTISLRITNGGTRSADGVDVATSGPWDRYTVLAVKPAGGFLRYPSGWHVLSPIAIAAGETATLEIRLRADEPSDEQLTFSVREAGFLVTH